MKSALAEGAGVALGGTMLGGDALSVVAGELKSADPLMSESDKQYAKESELLEHLFYR
jgi:hypothetical protein